jgi:hypothetical protein
MKTAIDMSHVSMSDMSEPLINDEFGIQLTTVPFP